MNISHSWLGLTTESNLSFWSFFKKSFFSIVVFFVLIVFWSLFKYIKFNLLKVCTVYIYIKFHTAKKNRRIHSTFWHYAHNIYFQTLKMDFTVMKKIWHRMKSGYWRFWKIVTRNTKICYENLKLWDVLTRRWTKSDDENVPCPVPV